MTVLHGAFSLRRTSFLRIALLLVLLSSAPLWLRAQGLPAGRPHPRKVYATVPAYDTPMTDKSIFAHVLFDQLEGRTSSLGTGLRWDGQGWIGSDMNRLWLKSEGFVRHGVTSDGDQEILYDRPIPRLKYFDAQVGMRADLDSYPGRTWAAIGIEGIAPYFFEFEPTLYIRGGGHVAGRINGAYNILLTQKLVLRPNAELNFYSKDDPPRRVGSGFSDIDTGVRLEYQFSRKFAPYIGYAYAGDFGNSARYVRMDHDTTSNSQLVFGVRLWY